MKVVHLGGGIIPVPPIGTGGIEVAIYLLTHHLGRLGCQVDVIDIRGEAYQREKREQSAASFHEVHRFRLPDSIRFPLLKRLLDYALLLLGLFLFAVPASMRLNKLLRRDKIDVIHAHTSLPALAAMAVNKLRRSPAATVYTMHTGFAATKLPWRMRLPALPEILALKWADHVVALTPIHQRWLASEFNLDPSKITQVYNGIDFDDVKQFLSNQPPVNDESPMVLCVGVISPRKNQLSAVKAIPQILAAHPEARFVFAGPVADAGYFDTIREFIAGNNLSDRVEFTGGVTRAEAFGLYSRASLFLFPTTAESLGLVLVEAMAFGLPVVASSVEPIEDVVAQQEGTAILFDPYDVDGMAAAVNRLLGDNSLRESMSQKARQRAEDFSYERLAAQEIAMYDRLIEEKRGAPAKEG